MRILLLCLNFQFTVLIGCLDLGGHKASISPRFEEASIKTRFSPHGVKFIKMAIKIISATRCRQILRGGGDRNLSNKVAAVCLY